VNPCPWRQGDLGKKKKQEAEGGDRRGSRVGWGGGSPTTRKKRNACQRGAAKKRTGRGKGTDGAEESRRPRSRQTVDSRPAQSGGKTQAGPSDGGGNGDRVDHNV